MVDKNAIEQLTSGIDNAEKRLGAYGEALSKVNGKKEENQVSRTVEIFFSFDIVNSSSYKDVNYFNWQIVLTSLLTSIQTDITKELPEAQLWRVLGDEIIFFVTIRNIDEVYTTIDAIYKVLVSSNMKLKNGSFFNGIFEKIKGKDINLIQNNNILGIKAAAWLAVVLKGQEVNQYDNIFKKYNINENQQINEFLGRDIDTGFRIKKETQERRLVLSIELAKILSSRTEYLSKLNIITYKTLKGVWKNRLYPIIWYHDEKISEVSFENSFYYDETTYSQLSMEYFLNREKDMGNLASFMYLNVNKALEKVIKDQKLEDKMNYIYNVIDDTKDDVKAVEEEFDNKLLEFHCAAVCCDVENKKVLIVKRKNRKIYSGLWEFGCAKANIEQNLCDSIVSDYKNDFGIDISVICDEKREDKEPKPIALYQVDKVEKLQKGVIVMAEIISNIDKVDGIIRETIQMKQKHEKYKWISEEEVDSFNEGAIQDFKDTLKKIFSLWDEFFRRSK